MAEKGKKKRLSKGQTKKLLPFMKQFNKVAKVLIKSLSKKLEFETQQLSKIAVMVSDVKVPERDYTINVQTLDINKTRVKKKGGFSFNQVMEWEKDMKKNNRNKGIVL